MYFSQSASVVLYKSISPGVPEAVDVPQMAEYFKARSLEKAELVPTSIVPPKSPKRSLPTSDIPVRPIPRRHVTFHVESDDADVQTLASSDASIFTTAESSQKHHSFFSQFARNRSKITSSPPSELIDVPSFPSPVNVSRRVLSRSMTEPAAKGASSATPSEDDESRSLDSVQSSPPLIRSPTILRRSMKGLRQVIRRKSTSRPSDIILSVATEGEEGSPSPSSDNHPSPADLDHTVSSPESPSFYPPTRRPTFLRNGSSRRQTLLCPTKKPPTIKPPPLRTAYTYTYVSTVDTSAEDAEDEQVQSPSSPRARLSHRRTQSTHEGKRVVSDPVVPVFTRLPPRHIVTYFDCDGCTSRRLRCLGRIFSFTASPSIYPLTIEHR